MSLDKTQAFNAARAYLLQNKIHAAIEIYKKIIEADPSDINAAEKLGELYASVGRVQDAMTQFRRLADGYIESGSLGQAIAMLKKILLLDPESDETATKLADTFASAGLSIEARQNYCQIADAYIRKGQTLDALRVYRKVAELDPTNVSTHIKLGELYMREGMREQAHDAFLAAAGQLAIEGDIGRAVNASDEAPALKPTSVEILPTSSKMTSFCTQPADEGLPGVASADAATANSANKYAPSTVAPSAVQASGPADRLPSKTSASAFVVQEISKAEILVAYGKVSQAIAVLGNVLRTEPDNVDVHIKLKDIYLRSGMMPDAMQQCFELARIHEQRGEHDRARDYAERASRLDQLIEHTSLDQQESPAKPADKIQIDTSNLPRPASDNETAPRVAQLASKLGASKLERIQLANRFIAQKAPASEISAQPAEISPPAAPLALIRKEPPSTRFGELELVTEPLQELAIDLLVRQKADTSGRPLPVPFEVSVQREKRRGWFYIAVASITLISLGAGALVGRSAYEAHLDKQYQELVLAAPPPDVASLLPTPPSQDSELLEQEEALTVVVTPVSQPEATPRPQRQETKVTQNQVASPQTASEPPKPTRPRLPNLPNIAKIDGGAGTQNGTPSGVPAAVLTGVPPPGPAPVEAPPKAVPKAQVLVRGGVLKRVQPAYPPAARTAQVSGVVTVEVSVNEQGDVTSARATSGPSLLRSAAVSAAYGWKFKPSTLGGVPVKSTTVIAFRFSL